MRIVVAICLWFLVACGAESASSGEAEISFDSVSEVTQAIACTSNPCDCPWGTSCGGGVCLPLPGPWPPPLSCPPPYSGPPIIEYSSDDGSLCGNTGIAHPSPGFLIRERIYGQPGASVTKWNRHASCGGFWWQDPGFNGVTLGASGMIEIHHPMSVPFACGGPEQGGWESIIYVNGAWSNIATFTYFNSGCAGFDTCGAAAASCPGRACNGPGCP